MDERTLLLLGILMSQRWHGYQIHDFIEKNLGRMTGMKKPTAYALLERLRKAGLVMEHVEQEGNRPQRHVYIITPEGETAFHALLRQNLGQADRARQGGDIGLLFLDHLPRPEAVHYLEQRLRQLEDLITDHQQIPSHDHVYGVDLALARQLSLLEADRDWLRSTLSSLKAEVRQ